MEEKNPLSPHIQIYNWHISSLVSISHRITGVFNIILISLICCMASFLLLGENNYFLIYQFLNSFFGKFFIIAMIWSFTFQILSELRHIFWDLGYGFDLKIANITGLLVIFGSLFFTPLIYLLGRIVL